ncbi:hypothetical protein CWR41_22760 [Cedecea lapagei]|nr:hypothetical protein CWR41_22760 [Cedecea lapagei]
MCGRGSLSELSAHAQLALGRAAALWSDGQPAVCGQAVPSITFSGEVYTDNRRISISPEEWVVGTRPVRELSELGDVQAPQLLISGIGEILGYWVVTDFSDTADRFLMAGIPKHQQFTMTIKYYGDNIYDPLGGYAG